MIEVFKTNVKDRDAAKNLVLQLHAKLIGCKANFDLEDCDLILRVQFADGQCDINEVISLLNKNGFLAEVLADEWPAD